MRSIFLPCLIASLWIAASVANAQNPLDAFRRGIEDGAKLREKWRGQRTLEHAATTLESRQQQIIQLQATGELERALQRADEQLTRVARTFGEASLEYSAILGLKAGILQDLGQYEQAIDLHRQALRLTGEAAGQASRLYARDLVNLADLLRVTGQFAEAHSLFEQATTISRQGADAKHLELRATALIGLGEVRRMLSRNAEAKEALAEAIKTAQSSREAQTALITVAMLNLGLIQAAEGNGQTALDKIEKMMPFIKGTPLDQTNLGLLMRGQRALLLSLLNRHPEAIAVAEETVRLAQRAAPSNLTAQAKVEAALGVVLVRAGRIDDAQPYLVAAIDTLMQPGQRIEDLVAPAFEEDRFRSLYLAALANVAAQRNDPSATRLLFAAAGRLQRPAVDRALRQMSFRSAIVDQAKLSITREIQDLENRIVAQRRILFRLPLEAGARQMILRKDIEKLLGEREGALQKLAKGTGALRAPISDTETTLQETRALLMPDEVLIRLIELPQPFELLPDVYIWIVTHETDRLVRIDAKASDLAREVAALRCGLDRLAWHGPGARACADLLKLPRDRVPGERDLLPFDTARAHALYKSLLGGAEDLLRGKHLVVVPSGALTKLPFQVLVTRELDPAMQPNEIRWLARDHALTVLPSVASLKALRRDAKPSRAERPMIGFGNPLLDGNEADPKNGSWHKKQAQQAREIHACRPATYERAAAPFGLRGAVLPVPTRDGIADLAHLKRQTPLPETADELCAVAREIGADLREMRLGLNATETELKRLSKAGELTRYRILHFATHGMLAGQISGTTEPGLILTPPGTATALDDGYLTASEIASLRLDADWAILSACNTAGEAGASGDAGEALGGLARVFFYAGARALLVSHWEVNSAATVKLITRSIRELSENGISRAEALRRAMLAMITSDDPREVHPASWAPFVLVGEGAALR